MKRICLLLLAAAVLLACCACKQAEDADAALIGKELSEAQQAAQGTPLSFCGDPDVWSVADGLLVIGSDDRATVDSVVRFSKDGEVTRQINTSVLTNADPLQWVGKTTAELSAQIGAPHYDLGVGYAGRRIVSYLTDDARLCYLSLLDDRVSHVRVCDLFSDRRELYPSGKVQVEEGAAVALIYRDAETAVDLKLSETERRQVIGLLNGKERHSDIPSEPMCGFTDQIAFRVGDRVFSPACDTCSIVMEYDTGLYLEISQAERDVIDGIFAAHGLRFPYQ